MWCYKTRATAAESCLCQTSRSWWAPPLCCSLWAQGQINPLFGPGAKTRCGPLFWNQFLFSFFLFFLHFPERLSGSFRAVVSLFVRPSTFSQLVQKATAFPSQLNDKFTVFNIETTGSLLHMCRCFELSAQQAHFYKLTSFIKLTVHRRALHTKQNGCKDQWWNETNPFTHIR